MTTSTKQQPEHDLDVLDLASGGGDGNQMDGREAEPELSGVDLARVALHHAREAARRRGAEPAAKRKPRAARRARDSGREPVGLAGALRGLLADHAWQAPVAGGGVLADWPRIAPDLAEHVQAIGYDPETATLELRPASSAFGTYLRLNSASVIGRINTHTGDTTVRHLKVLSTGTNVGAASAPVLNQAGPAATAATVPEPREHSAGYQRALAALQSASRAADALASATREASERQAAAIAREREDAFVSGLEERLHLGAQRRWADDVRTKALGRAHHERAAQHLPAVAPVRAPRDTAGLGRSA